MPRPLNFQQSKFVYYYLNDAAGNATEAAELAGYHHPTVAGSRLLRRVNVKAAIKEACPEACMSAAEVLARLNEQASLDVGELKGCYKEEIIQVSPGVERSRQYLDFDEMRRRGLTRSVKKLVSRRDGRLEVEFHDSQAALITLAKVHGLLRDRLSLDNFDPDQLTDEQLRAIVKQSRAQQALPSPDRSS